MKHHLNTLFVTTDGAYLFKDGLSVAVRVDGDVKLRMPLHVLGGIACFGRVSCSTPLLAAATQAGVAISFLDRNGRFLARVCGFTPGNVRVRREQYRHADGAAQSLAIAAAMVAGKIANTRTVLLRTAREHADPAAAGRLSAAAASLAHSLRAAQAAADLDTLRGVEGEAANLYFGVFNDLIGAPPAHRLEFSFNGRTRRPPLDRVNALLSFLYAMLAHDCRSACEAAGLDPAVGFLHRDRPGRPGLALDLMEEFRPLIADRLVLSLINRQQVHPDGFEVTESGAVRMSDATRKAVITAYQARKQESLTHPFLDERVTVGLLPHLQARLVARLLRGELDAYPPFLWK